MPVDLFSFEALTFYLIVLAIASPFVLFIGMLVYWIRQHNKSWQRRGFEAELNVKETRQKRDKVGTQS